MGILKLISKISEFYFLAIGTSLLVTGVSLKYTNYDTIYSIGLIFLIIGIIFFVVNYFNKENSPQKSTIFNKEGKPVGFILSNPEI